MARGNWEEAREKVLISGGTNRDKERKAGTVALVFEKQLEYSLLAGEQRMKS